MVNFKTLTALTAALLLLFAAAHATVKMETGTSESETGAYETFRLHLRVPVEKDMATIQVRLVVPAGLKIGAFLPVSGFARTVNADSNGVITEVTWEGQIRPVEFQRFLFSAQDPADAGTLTWKVYQTHADGTVVSRDDSDLSTPPARSPSRPSGKRA
jgi:uncharacterized protein YcnI